MAEILNIQFLEPEECTACSKSRSVQVAELSVRIGRGVVESQFRQNAIDT
jgi:hypothetical protein